MNPDTLPQFARALVVLGVALFVLAIAMARHPRRSKW